MATADQIAAAYQRRQAQISTAATKAAVKQFDQLDGHALSESWAGGGGATLTRIVGQAQLAAAEEAAPYLAEMAAAQGANAARLLGAAVVAQALAGIASDGRPLMSLLYLPVLLIKRLIGDGMKLREALAQGRRMTALLASTQVADAGRGAVMVGMAAERTWVTYVRVVHLPACGRCIVLAGREYSYSMGFQRHPRCDCTMAPRVGRGAEIEGPRPLSPSELFAQMDAAEQDKAFTKSGAEAIRLGANIGQVVNARRGMKQASIFGRDVLITTEGTTKRGFAGKRLMNQGAKTRREEAGLAIRQTASGPELRRIHQTRVITPRLMPEAILDAAKGDRDEAIRLLHRFGYLI